MLGLVPVDGIGELAALLGKGWELRDTKEVEGRLVLTLGKDGVETFRSVPKGATVPEGPLRLFA